MPERITKTKAFGSSPLESSFRRNHRLSNEEVDGFFDAKRVSKVRAPEIEKHQKLVTDLKSYKNQLLDVGSAFCSGEGGSWNITKKELKTAPLKSMAKGAGFFYRFGLISAPYVARLTSIQIWRAYGLAHNMTAKAVKKAAPMAGAVGATQALTGWYCAGQGIGALKIAYNIGYNTYADVKTHGARKRFHALIENYNPKTGKFKALDGREVTNQGATRAIQSILAKKYDFRTKDGADVTRTKKQILGDRIFQGSDFYVRSAVATAMGLNLAHAGTMAATASPIFNVVGYGSLVAINAYRCGMHIAAINNALSASAKATSPLYQALARHVINQRLDPARLRLMQTGASTFMTIVAGSVAAGAATPIAPVTVGCGIAGTALMSTMHIAGTLYEFKHARKLDKYRAKAADEAREIWDKAPALGKSAQDLTTKRAQYFADHATKPEQIGFAEHFLVRQLRGNNALEKEQSVEFLENLGFSKQTIIKMQLAPSEADALVTLRVNLYTNKLKFKPRNTLYTGVAFENVVGITSLERGIKKMIAKYKARNVAPLGATA